MDSFEEILGFGGCINEWISEGMSQLKLLNLDEISARVADAKENGSPSFLEDLLKDLKLHAEDATGKGSQRAKPVKKQISENNNTTSTINTTSSNKSNDELDTTESGRPRRKAFTDATERVNVQVNAPLNTKLRQPRPVKIKTERISEEVAELLPQERAENAENEEMPPPAALPKRAGRKKKGESAVKVERTSSRTARARNTNQLDLPETVSESEEDSTGTEKKRSDVLLIEQPVDTINLDEEQSDVDGEVSAAKGKAAKKEAAKRTRSPSIETKKVGRPKRTKRKESAPSKDRDTDTSLYEDAVEAEVIKSPPKEQEIEMQLPTVMVSRLSKEQIAEATGNTTVVISKTKPVVMNETIVISKSNVNTTVVVEKPKMLNATVTVSKPLDDLMTDDESEKERSPPVAVKKVGQQLFSAFENSPVKKKVEAFEKLGAAASTTRITRTKTRQKAKAAEDGKSDLASPKKKAAAGGGYTTPQMTNRALPAFSASKAQLSDTAKKALSAIKLSSQQFRDYEQVRKEKEAEAMKKKESLLAKATEEKRRKREEKEAKAKLQREQLDKEKKRIMEQQKAKEEKQAQLLLEKQERITKQREEAEKRRLLVKQKHDELRREDERKRNEAAVAQKKLEEEERRRQEEEKQAQALKMRQMQKECKAVPTAVQPIYMTQTAPLLPTPDCYDSDDENAPKRPELPVWNSKEALHQRMRAMSYIDDKVRNTFFCVKAQTPNLNELFPNLDPRKLRRNSSAVWSQAPRFTMAVLNEDF